MQVTIIRIYFVSFFLLCVGKSAKKRDCDHLITAESEWRLEFDSSSDTYSFMKTRDLSETQSSHPERNVRSFFRNLPSWNEQEAGEIGDLRRLRLCVAAPPKQIIVLKIPQSGNGSRFLNKSISENCFYPYFTAWQSTSTKPKRAPLDRNAPHLPSRKKMFSSREIRQLCRTAVGRQNHKQICSKHKKRRRLKQEGCFNSSLAASRRHSDVKNNDLSPKERLIGNPSQRISDKASITSSKPPLTPNVHTKVTKTRKKSRKKRQVSHPKINNWLRIFQLCSNSNSSLFNDQNVPNSSSRYSVDGNSSNTRVKTARVRGQSTNVVINTSSSVLFIELKWIVKSQLPSLDLHFRFKSTTQIIAGTLTSTSEPQSQAIPPPPTTSSAPRLQNNTDVTIPHNHVQNNSVSSLIIVISLATLFFMALFLLTCCVCQWLRKRSSNRRLNLCDIFHQEISSRVERININEQITEPGGKYCCEKTILKSHHHHTTRNSEHIKNHLVGGIETCTCYRPYSRHKDKNKSRCSSCCNSLDSIAGNTPLMLYPSHNRKPAGAKGLMHNNISTTQLTYSRPQNNPYTAESLSLRSPKCSASPIYSRDARSDDVTLHVTKLSKPSSRMGYHDAKPVMSSCVRAPPNRTVSHGSTLDNLSRVGNAQNSATPFHSVTPASSDPVVRGGVLTCPSRTSNDPSSSNNSNQIATFYQATEPRDEIPPPEYSSPPEYNSISSDFSPT